MTEINPAVVIEDISSVKKKLSFDIPWTEVKDELDIVYRKIGKTAKIKGFRPGKIPREILEKYYRDQTEEETVSNLVNRYYWETLRDREIPAVTHPTIEQKGIETGKAFNFSATVEIEPIIEPKNYLGLEIEKEEPIVSEKDLETRLMDIRHMFATMEDLDEDRGVMAGDFTTIDFTGMLEGQSLKELASDNYLLEIGSNTFIPGFEDQLIGMKKGERKTLPVTFPETYHVPHLKGKNVEFTVTVKGIRIKKLPVVDEHFVKNFERYESLEDLKADIRKNLEEEKKKKAAADVERRIGEKLLIGNEFEVPESFIEQQIYYMMADAQRRMVAGGMDKKRAAELSVKLHDQFREEAIKIVKTVLLIKSIARKESLTVGDGEVEQRIREMAAQRGQNYDTMRQTLEKDDMIDTIRGELLNHKSYDFLVKNAKITVINSNAGSQGE